MKTKCVCGPVENRGIGNHQSWCPVREAQRLDSRIRLGDMVRVVKGERVVRVGYPKSLDDYRKEVLEGYRAELVSLVRRVSGDKPPPFPGPEFDALGAQKAFEEIVGALAYRLATKKRWGGIKRSVHVESAPGWANRTARVLRRACARVGTYSPGGGYYEDYEPPGLDCAKTAVLFCLSDAPLSSPEDKTLYPCDSWNSRSLYWRRENFRKGIWFQADCLEKVLEDGH